MMPCMYELINHSLSERLCGPSSVCACLCVCSIGLYSSHCFLLRFFSFCLLCFSSKIIAFFIWVVGVVIKPFIPDPNCIFLFEWPFPCLREDPFFNAFSYLKGKFFLSSFFNSLCTECRRPLFLDPHVHFHMSWRYVCVWASWLLSTCPLLKKKIIFGLLTTQNRNTDLNLYLNVLLVYRHVEVREVLCNSFTLCQA